MELTQARRPALRAPAGLPKDVIILIVAEADPVTQKQSRLCCKWLAREAARHVFAKLNVEMRAESMERVVRVANNMTFAGFVRELELFPVTKLLDYKFEDWCTAANFSWGKFI